MANKIIHCSGKRKRAVARATLKSGTGKLKVNNKSIEIITPKTAMLKIQEPLIIAEDTAAGVDISVTIKGGGYNSQAEAARLAIARALVRYDKKLEKDFLDYDRQLLVADVRRKEVHKPNTSKSARAKRQKSYR